MKIPAIALYRLAVYTDPSAKLEALSCVKMTRGRALATNGVSLLVFNSDDLDMRNGDECSLFVGKDALKHLKHKDADHAKLDSGRLVVVDKFDSEIYIQPGSADKKYLFPDYERVAGFDDPCKVSAVPRIGLRTSAIEVVQKAFGKDSSMHIDFYGEAEPAFYTLYVEGTPLDEYRGCILPVKKIEG